MCEWRVAHHPMLHNLYLKSDLYKSSNQAKLLDKVIVVLEEGVPVSLCLKCRHPVKVMDVNMNKDPEHPSQNLLTGSLEVLFSEHNNTLTTKFNNKVSDMNTLVDG